MNSIADTYQKCGLTPSVAQLALAKSILGESLNAAEFAIWQACTGRETYPATRFQEVAALCGRQSGKTEFVGAPLVVHCAATESDESGTILLVAPSKSDQARRAWSSVNAQLQRGFPGIVSDVTESEGRIQLYNGNEIRFAAANFRNLRGPRYKLVTIDEACFFVSDNPDDGGSNPLPFILDSVAGGMIAVKDPLLLLLSTPWNKSGVMFEHFRDRDANPDRLSWRAPTLLMNPHANQALMARHKKDCGENFYRREYLAEFSEDSFAFIESADVDAAIVEGMPFFSPKPGVRYCMGLDPGRKRDHFGAAIAHREADSLVVDWCAEWRPGLSGLKYSDVLPVIFQKAREYHVRKIASDQIDFGGIESSVPLVNGRPEFQMERIMTGGQSGAELADTTRGLFASRKLLLPDVAGLADEFKRLADFLTQGGIRDVRATRGHDDRSRAVMLAVHQAFQQLAAHAPMVFYLSTARDPHDRFFKR